MSTSLKAEVSLEFIALVGFILVIFVFMITVIGLRNRDISDSIIYSDAQRIVDSVVFEINTASIIDGYYREFMLPTQIANTKNYSIVIINELRLIQILWDNQNIISNIMSGNVSGEAKPGINIIRNNGGLITIES